MGSCYTLEVGEAEAHASVNEKSSFISIKDYMTMTMRKQSEERRKIFQ